MTKRRLQTASLDQLPPEVDASLIDPLVLARTRFSEDRRHRFTLFRHWGDPNNFMACCGMNPSGADAFADDKSVIRACGFAERWGFGALYMLNAMSVRLTDSRRLSSAPCVNLPENDQWIRSVVRDAGLVLLAWGNPAAKFGRSGDVEQILREECDPLKVRCFGKNKNGTPVHLLYQRNDAVPTPYFAE